MNVIAAYCKASTVGIAPVYYRWERYNLMNNSWIRPSQRAINITSPQLEFNVITEEDQGVYRCIAANDDDNIISDNVTIIVYGECSYNHQCYDILHISI